MTAESIPVSRLNHAVLYVRDLDTSVEFYKRDIDAEVCRHGTAAATTSPAE